MTTAFLLVILVTLISALPQNDKHFPEKIVGGTPATRGEFPWIVQVRVGGLYCGGSIVNANWIVTAAHCSLLASSQYTILAGAYELNDGSVTVQSRNVSKVITHPNYNKNTLVNDIALFKVEKSLIFGKAVNAANLAEPGFTPAANVVTAGWGTIKEGGSLPVVLLKVTVPIVSDEKCKQDYGAGSILPGMICAGTGGKDSCQGDSGGPLMSGNTLCGIVSWGRGCARPNFPGVYTEVSKFHKWILDNTK